MNFKVGKNRKYDAEGFSKKENVFIFLKAFFPKLGKCKIRQWYSTVLFQFTIHLLRGAFLNISSSGNIERLLSKYKSLLFSCIPNFYVLQLGKKTFANPS